MQLATLIPEGADDAVGEARVSGVMADSRRVYPGALFICMPSASRDTHDFLETVRDSGASAAITHTRAGFERAKALGLPALLIELGPGSGETEEERARSLTGRFSLAVSRIAKAAAGNPSERLRVIGVTGTNGKTSTAWLLRDGLAALDSPAAYLGTLGLQLPDQPLRELSNTTPFAPELMGLVGEAAEDARCLCMEVSSHALAEHRSDGVEFDAGILTNLTQDHLNYHGNMEAYEEAKWRLFGEYPKLSEKPFTAVFNVDSYAGLRFSERFHGMRITVGQSPAATLRHEARGVGLDRMEIAFTFEGRTEMAHARLGGRYNVENVASAVAGLMALHVGFEDAVAAAAHMTPVPGRFEAVPNDREITVLVDYAHTPDALQKLVQGVRELSDGRIHLVFGCGGDRDRDKRPQMGAIAAKGADRVYVTNDNPRTESPPDIVSEIMAGIEDSDKVNVILDRAEAVAAAARFASPGDVIVIAGKGHEHYQILGTEKHPMDDRQLALAGLEARK